MDNITILDTSIATDNLGDEIIMDAVNDAVSRLLPDAYVYRIASHEYMSWVSRRIIEKSRMCIVGGTNLLSSSMGIFSLWKLTPWDLSKLSRVVLMGVGWRDYMGNPDMYTRLILRRMMASPYMHSVRDSYTLAKLNFAGGKAINTACPTMWSLTEEHCAKIPRTKGESAATTVTYYNPDPVHDRILLTTLKEHYQRVYFWPQQSEDDAYFRSLGIDGIQSIRPSLKAYDQVLMNEGCDFIGTRLHGGIRALQKGRRCLIIGIDNRAAEISKDSDLPVLLRGKSADLVNWIYGEAPTRVQLPLAAIAEWKAQFIGTESGARSRWAVPKGLTRNLVSEATNG